MRRPLKAALANRRMFRNGGMASPRSMGILSSSPNLIEAVSRDALNPQGGPTLGMNQGGIARMQQGGKVVLPTWMRSPIPHPDYTISPSIRREIMQYGGNPRTSSMQVPSLSLNISDTGQISRGTTSLNELLNQPPSVRARRIFNPALAGGIEGIRSKRTEGPPSSRVGSWLQGALQGAKEIGQDVGAAVGEEAQNVGATYDWLFDVDSSKMTPAQIRAIAEMRQQYPTLAKDIGAFSEIAIQQNGDIGKEELVEKVATDLHNKYERTPELMSAIEFQESGNVTASERLLKTLEAQSDIISRDQPPSALSPTSPPGGTIGDPEAAMQAQAKQDLANYKNAQDPQAFIRDLQDTDPQRASLVISSIQEFGGATEPPLDAFYQEYEQGKVKDSDLRALQDAAATDPEEFRVRTKVGDILGLEEDMKQQPPTAAGKEFIRQANMLRPESVGEFDDIERAVQSRSATSMLEDQPPNEFLVREKPRGPPSTVEAAAAVAEATAKADPAAAAKVTEAKVEEDIKAVNSLFVF